MQKNRTTQQVSKEIAIIAEASEKKRAAKKKKVEEKEANMIEDK